jgi:HTH-type transcriptional regulator/antitoxin MqsA
MNVREGMLCPVCEVGKLQTIIKDLEFEYKGERTVCRDRRAFVCSVCAEEFLAAKDERAIERRLTDARRKVDGLLTSVEIRAIRRRFGFTQVQFAEVLGVGKKNFARYESGQASQGRATDNLLRILRERPDTIRVIAASSSVVLKEEIEDGEWYTEKYQPNFRQRTFQATCQACGAADDYHLLETALG